MSENAAVVDRPSLKLVNWRINQFALEEEERRRHAGNSTGSIGNQIDATCDRINQSANNSGTFKTKELSPKSQEMILIAAILLGKFCLWFLYRTAQTNDIDVTGL